MFNDINYLYFLTILSSLVTFISIVLFILRFVCFYQKGIAHSKYSKNYPTLKEIHLVYFSIGIIAPLIICFIPFISVLVLISAFICFQKIKDLITENFKPSLQKPEKIALVGFGMGLSGLLAYLLGFYRGKQFPDDINENQKTIDIENTKSN